MQLGLRGPVPAQTNEVTTPVGRELVGVEDTDAKPGIGRFDSFQLHGGSFEELLALQLVMVAGDKKQRAGGKGAGPLQLQNKLPEQKVLY